MIVSKIVLLILRQIIPVISTALISQSVLTPDIKKENDGADDTQPNQAEPKTKSKRIFGCLASEKHVAREWSVDVSKVGSLILTMR